MDPISHAIIGLSIYGLQQTPEISNPALLGTIIGALAPDFDIVTKIRSDYVYLKHHRVETHSLLGVVVISVLITLGLSFFYPMFAFGEVLIWTLIGTLSHILFDLLNSYGVALLYPFSSKKFSLNLITIYDPVVLLLSGYVLFLSKRTLHENLSVTFIFFLYLILKEINKKSLTKKIGSYYRNECINAKINRINVMPSDYSVIKWDYIVCTEKEYIVGEIKSYNGFPRAFKRLAKTFDPIIEKTENEVLGLYFKNFTPIFHVEFEQEKNGFIVKMIDLRYKVKNGFKHHAMFYYSDNSQLIKSVFHPFNMDNQIEVRKNTL
ncbi:metal-dependent hydrolase [Alkalicella caledoniensis]|uniref:Metal-dependent hydrolase n=1 Tax=Alkalicella caledoniensis TaxID=2731377 RepID=A0A7G9W6D8_ALKCA|nr:metal-dependent hydrolase [Alkalicella caledoniensis]QNO14250.1 metal-dependent hydrolase [Alkalicella caledoniensis]